MRAFESKKTKFCKEIIHLVLCLKEKKLSSTLDSNVHLQSLQVSQCFHHSLLCISSMRISFSNHGDSHHALVRVWSCGVVGRGAVVCPCLPLAVAVGTLLGGEAVGSCTCNKGTTN
jgi:hypothetical protein